MAFSTHFSWNLLTIALFFFVLTKGISAQCTSELSVSISEVSPRSGAFVQFSCNVSFANFDEASWYLGETILVMGMNKLVDNPRLFLPGEVDIGDGCFNFGMGIVGILPEDAGEYTCRIGNDTSTATGLDVLVRPDSIYPTCLADLDVGASSTGENVTVTLACRTQTGNPPWSPTWGSTLLGGVQNVSTSGAFTTSLLRLPATPEVLGSTFTCSAACNSSHAECLPSDMRSCSVDGLFLASPMDHRFDVGDNANYTCKTSIRNTMVMWMIPEELQTATVVNTECSRDNTTCTLILANVDSLANGTRIPCVLSQVNSNEIMFVSSVTVIVVPESTTSMSTTKETITMSTISLPATSRQPSTSQQPSTPFIPPPPPSPPPTPFVGSTPPSSTVSPTSFPTTTIPATISDTTTTAAITTTTTTPSPPPTTTTTTTATTTPTISATFPTTRSPALPRTSSPPFPPVLTRTSSGPAANVSTVSPTPGSGQNNAAGVSVGEIIAIVVTISILLILLIVLFTCVLIRKNASSEKRGKRRRDAAMLDSQAPSPFNAYDMQTVLGGQDAKEMSGPTEEKSGVDESTGYLLPIPDLDGEDIDDNSFDNPAFDKDSSLYASIPSKSNSVNEVLYQNTQEDRYQNGSIDQGYYEHYPDPELGGGTKIVHGVISTVL